MSDIKFGLGVISSQAFQKSQEEFLNLFSADFLKTINPAKSVDDTVKELKRLYGKYGVEKSKIKQGK